MTGPIERGMETYPEIRLGPSTRRCLQRYRASLELRHAILDALEREERPPRSLRSWLSARRGLLRAAGSGFAAGALASALALSASLEVALGESTAQEVVASHVRSLMADHLADVASSDTAMVTSWLGNRLDFVPLVSDAPSRGYALVGGRLDYIGGRPVAAVVYRQAGHTINVFTCPRTGGAPVERNLSRRGFNAIGWSDAAMQYWAVADTDADELKRFTDALRRPKDPSPAGNNAPSRRVLM